MIKLNKNNQFIFSPKLSVYQKYNNSLHTMHYTMPLPETGIIIQHHLFAVVVFTKLATDIIS